MISDQMRKNKSRLDQSELREIIRTKQDLNQFTLKKRGNKLKNININKNINRDKLVKAKDMVRE